MSNDLFIRTTMLLGQEAMDKLAFARVAVIGVGGVGSFAVEALARSGVGSLLLVDDDIVAPSNINRQLHATTTTVGQHKTILMAQRARDINPEIQVKTVEGFVLGENISQILQEPLDYVIDAVDTVSAKLAIVAHSKEREIPVISCMGAGNKLDPTRFQVGDIYETSICPLCRVMRRELRKRKICSLQVVYSTESPRTPIAISSDENAAHPKRQTPGSISFVPSVAGLIAAGVVIKNIAGVEE